MEKRVDGRFRSLVFPFLRALTRRTHTVLLPSPMILPSAKSMEKGWG